MNESWYELVSCETPLTQGDIVLSCPVLSWSTSKPAPGNDDVKALKHLMESFSVDLVVLTQACDLEHGKVSNVVLCPHLPLNEYRLLWEDLVRSSGQNPSEKSWRRLCEDIANGHIWNHAFLNDAEASLPAPCADVRVVEFHEVYTLPRTFVESYLKQRRDDRLRLLPPYREHLSQAFARYFMRVGLPTPIKKKW